MSQTSATRKYCKNKAQTGSVWSLFFFGGLGCGNYAREETIKGGNYQLLGGFDRRNYLKEEIIQGKKLYEEVRYLKKITGPTKKDFLNSLEIISTHCYE